MTTVRDLSRELQVPMSEIIKRLMNLNSMKSAIQELTDSEESILRTELENFVPSPHRLPPSRPG
jgi:hypothetical protein